MSMRLGILTSGKTAQILVPEAAGLMNQTFRRSNSKTSIPVMRTTWRFQAMRLAAIRRPDRKTTSRQAGPHMRAAKKAPTNSGQVSFTPTMGEGRSRIDLELNYESQDALEKVGVATGAVQPRAQKDLERFNQFIEKRGEETGAWRRPYLSNWR
jgi:hypothetical protein